MTEDQIETADDVEPGFAQRHPSVRALMDCRMCVVTATDSRSAHPSLIKHRKNRMIVLHTSLRLL